jgi:hypothetical protein
VFYNARTKTVHTIDGLERRPEGQLAELDEQRIPLADRQQLRRLRVPACGEQLERALREAPASAALPDTQDLGGRELAHPA